MLLYHRRRSSRTVSSGARRATLAAEFLMTSNTLSDTPIREAASPDCGSQRAFFDANHLSNNLSLSLLWFVHSIENGHALQDCSHVSCRDIGHYIRTRTCFPDSGKRDPDSRVNQNDPFEGRCSSEFAHLQKGTCLDEVDEPMSQTARLCGKSASRASSSASVHGRQQELQNRNSGTPSRFDGWET